MHLCKGSVLLTRPDADCQKQLKKKQKNRVAAQRSRQKHTDKADALHQQHESLEKHNHALRKEIQALQAELERWNQTLHLHKRLCHLDCASPRAPAPSSCWDQGQRLLGPPAPHGQHGCQEQLGLFQTPVSSPPAQQLSPDLHPHDSLGLLPSLSPSLSLDHAMVTVPPAQLSPSPGLSASPTGSSLLGLELSTLLPSPPAQPTPPQYPGLEHPTRGKLGTSPHNPSAALGPGGLQREPRPVLLTVDPGAHPLLAFPLLSSAQVPF